MNNFYIYKYVDINNNIVYIGKTTQKIRQRINQHKRDKLKNFKGNIYYFECSNKTNMDMLEYVLINKYHPIHNVQYKDFEIQTDMKEPNWILYRENDIIISSIKKQNNKVFKPKKINTSLFDNQNIITQKDNTNIFIKCKLSLQESKIVCALLFLELKYDKKFFTVQDYKNIMNLKYDCDLYNTFNILEKKHVLRKCFGQSTFMLDVLFLTNDFLHNLTEKQLLLILSTNCKYLPYFIDKINLDKKEIKIDREFIEKNTNYKNGSDIEKRIIIPILNTLELKEYQKNHITSGRSHKITTFIYKW